jgi:hypothetical protein
VVDLYFLMVILHFFFKEAFGDNVAPVVQLFYKGKEFKELKST